MAKIWEMKTTDVDQVKCIKDGADQLPMKDEEIKHRWREYFESCSMGRMRVLPLHWATPLMGPACVLCGESRSLRSRRL